MLLQSTKTQTLKKIPYHKRSTRRISKALCLHLPTSSKLMQICNFKHLLSTSSIIGRPWISSTQVLLSVGQKGKGEQEAAIYRGRFPAATNQGRQPYHTWRRTRGRRSIPQPPPRSRSGLPRRGSAVTRVMPPSSSEASLLNLRFRSEEPRRGDAGQFCCVREDLGGFPVVASCGRTKSLGVPSAAVWGLRWAWEKRKER